MIDYRGIVALCEEDFDRHGDTYLGAGWTRSGEHADRRYDIMLDLVARQPRPCSVLDFGCGTARLFDRAVRTGAAAGIDYSGLDMSERVLAHARSKHPARSFHAIDVLVDPGELPMYDVVLMNGIFHYRDGNSFDDMYDYTAALLTALWPHTAKALAFNVMSTHVDWERDDLFHLPMGRAADLVAGRLSRRFTLREDYGLYEYTVYVHR